MLTKKVTLTMQGVNIARVVQNSKLLLVVLRDPLICLFLLRSLKVFGTHLKYKIMCKNTSSINMKYDTPSSSLIELSNLVYLSVVVAKTFDLLSIR